MLSLVPVWNLPDITRIVENAFNVCKTCRSTIATTRRVWKKVD